MKNFRLTNAKQRNKARSVTMQISLVSGLSTDDFPRGGLSHCGMPPFSV